MQPAISPGTDLIAHAVSESVDDAFRFVFVFAFQHGEQHFARWPHERERGRASQHLENCKHSK